MYNYGQYQQWVRMEEIVLDEVRGIYKEKWEQEAQSAKIQTACEDSKKQCQEIVKANNYFYMY